MKTNKFKNILILVLCLMALSSFNGFAQNDSIPVTEKVKKEKKKSDSFKVLVGGTLNSISLTSNQYDASSNIGYMFGAKYKRGKFFYWELGARYNAARFTFTEASINDGVSINSIDVPINVGVNLLSVTSRLVGLRFYVGAVPTFTTKVGNNELNITNDDINSFRMYGQAGLGVDIAFFFLETGVNYGFTDVFENINSKHTQVFFNLGFRF
ncbi:outer membrane beta-barrel protein [Muriicola sp.]|uniref:outer membrane beta-barrel protein n=1 Tax=Muriicola sp. TaxID=2020856 RepID=UPI003C70A92D